MRRKKSKITISCVTWDLNLVKGFSIRGNFRRSSGSGWIDQIPTSFVAIFDVRVEVDGLIKVPLVFVAIFDVRVEVDGLIKFLLVTWQFSWIRILHKKAYQNHGGGRYGTCDTFYVKWTRAKFFFSRNGSASDLESGG
eukprot:g50053.t1